MSTKIENLFRHGAGDLPQRLELPTRRTDLDRWTVISGQVFATIDFEISRDPEVGASPSSRFLRKIDVSSKQHYRSRTESSISGDLHTTELPPTKNNTLLQ